MSFRPTSDQLAVLRALAYLECDGCLSAGPEGRPTVPKIRFSGVPEPLLRAWVQVDGEAFTSTILPMERRRLIRSTRKRAWPFPWAKFRFALPDERVMDMERRRVTPDEVGRLLQQTCGGIYKPAPRSRTRTRVAEPEHATNLLEARFEEHRRAGPRVARFYRTINMIDAGCFLSITDRGLQLHDTIGDDFQPNELVRLSQCAPLTGLSKRTIERHLRRGDIPRPDVVGGDGSANLWYWSSIRPPLQAITKRLLPERFPGSRVI